MAKKKETALELLLRLTEADRLRAVRLGHAAADYSWKVQYAAVAGAHDVTAARIRRAIRKAAP